MSLSDKPVLEESEGPGSPPPYKMIQTIGLSVGAAVAYIIAVLGLMFYCKKRCKAKRLQKQPEGEEPEMECLNGEGLPSRGRWCGALVLSALLRPWRREPWHWRKQAAAERWVLELCLPGPELPHPQLEACSWPISRALASEKPGLRLPHWSPLDQLPMFPCLLPAALSHRYN